MAVADFNGDGRLDLAINNNNSRPSLFSNHLAAGNWLRLDLVGSDSNRDAVGARVSLTLPGGARTLTRWVEAGSAYASQSAFPLHFGLGDAEAVEAVEITWPSGAVTRLEGGELGVNRTLRVDEAAGVAVAAAPAMPAEPEVEASAGG